MSIIDNKVNWICNTNFINLSYTFKSYLSYSNPILFVAKILLLFRQQATGNSQQVRVSTFLSTFCAIYTNKPVEFLSTERLLNPPTAIDVSGV